VIVYVDTSVVVRRLLGQAEPITGWGEWDAAYASVLCRTEFYRTLDRVRMEGGIADVDRSAVGDRFELFWETCHRVGLSEPVLRRAEEAFPTVLGTLDAIHLASAIVADRVSKAQIEEILTHDIQLARAARASGYRVRGADSP
jgi:predicted nucleic acid-binding protein